MKHAADIDYIIIPKNSNVYEKVHEDEDNYNGIFRVDTIRNESEFQDYHRDMIEDAINFEESKLIIIYRSRLRIKKHIKRIKAVTSQVSLKQKHSRNSAFRRQLSVFIAYKTLENPNYSYVGKLLDVKAGTARHNVLQIESDIKYAPVERRKAIIDTCKKFKIEI